jgi:uncharacterized membrane protein YgaE (UPF0421/DUF939 family)
MSLDAIAGRALAAARDRGLGWLRDAGQRAPEVVRVSGASALAWFVARRLGCELPVLAPLATLVTVQRTAYATIREGGRQAAGGVLGASAALVAGVVIGLHAWTVALTVAVALLVSARSTGSQAATTALLVLALGLRYGHVRIEALLVGSAVGVAVGVLTPLPLVAPARRTLSGLAATTSALLRDVAEGVRAPFGTAASQEWLRRARALDDDLGRARRAAQDARDSVRWTPLVHLPAARELRLDEAVDALAHVVGQVRTIARELADLAAEHDEQHGDEHPWLAVGVHDGLMAAVEGLSAYADALAAADAHDRETLHRRAAALRHVIRGIDPPPATGRHWARVQAQLLTEAERVLAEIDPRGAHPVWLADGVTSPT